MIDKKYCMSSYLAFRYIEKNDVDFYDGLKHRNIIPMPEEERVLVKTAKEIGQEVKKYLHQFKNKKIVYYELNRHRKFLWKLFSLVKSFPQTLTSFLKKA